MNGQELNAFIAKNKLNTTSLSRITGVARTTIDRYRSDEATIPRVFEMACQLIERQERDRRLNQILASLGPE